MLQQLTRSGYCLQPLPKQQTKRRVVARPTRELARFHERCHRLHLRVQLTKFRQLRCLHDGLPQQQRELQRASLPDAARQTQSGFVAVAAAVAAALWKRMGILHLNFRLRIAHWQRRGVPVRASTRLRLRPMLRLTTCQLPSHCHLLLQRQHQQLWPKLHQHLQRVEHQRQSEARFSNRPMHLPEQ